jgi:hypothetical protein
MNAMATSSISTSDAIRQRFTASEIGKAAIIDDTFDGITAEYLKEGLGKFIDDLGDADHLPELQKLLPNVTEPELFDVDAAKILWDKKAQWPAKITPLANELFAEYEKKLGRLVEIQKGLEGLGLHVQIFGADGAKPDVLADVQILFLDYQLEPTPTVATAEASAAAGAHSGQQIRAATTKAEKIAFELAAGERRPFLVLISSISNLAEVQANFRERTNYVGGTFGFLSKEKAANAPELYYHIRSWAIGHPALPVVTDFIATLQRSATDVAREFGMTLLKLEVQDYSFIQRLSLAADGEPLGEYMLHLLSESLSHRLRNHPAVIAARTRLDKVHFENHLPSIVRPSDTVSRLYHEALTDRGPEKLAPHPLQDAQKPQPTTIFPRIMQGDVFLSPCRSFAYVVANCGCDLQYSPVNKDRQPDPETPLLLVKGMLKPFSEDPGRANFVRTEPFLIDDVPYRILWNPNQVKPMSRGDFTGWCAAEKFERIARLREVQAAAIQQAWSATMARIGLPVAPPSFSSADYELYIERDGKWDKAGATVVGQVVLTEHVKEREIIHSFTLTSAGVQALAEGFSAAAAVLKEALAKYPPSGEHAAKVTIARQTAIDETARYALDLGELFVLMEQEHPLKREAGKVWKSSAGTVPICFTWQQDLQGKKVSETKLPNKPSLLVNVLAPVATGAKPATASPVPAADTVSVMLA